MADPLKRVCDHDKYKVLPCPNAGVKLDEYWDTMIRGRGGWGNLCRECVINHGYPHSQSTTQMVWDGVAGCYIKKRKEPKPVRTNIHQPPLMQAAGDWMHCPCGNDVSGAGFHPCKMNGAYCEPDVNWDSGWYRCDGCGQRYIDHTHTFKAMIGLAQDVFPEFTKE